MINIVSYNEYEIQLNGSIQDIKKGFNVWIDITDPYIDDILRIFGQLNTGGESLEWYLETSLKPDKPEVRVFQNHRHTTISIMKNDSIKEGIHMLLGENWLLSLHSSKIDLMCFADRLLKNNRTASGRMYILYYDLIEHVVASYEQLLTPIESCLDEFETGGNTRPEDIFEYVTQLSRELSSVKIYFKNIRSFLNVLIHNATNGEEFKHIDPALSKVDQFGGLIKSYESEIHSIHQSHIARSALKTEDRLRVFTMFFALSLFMISMVFLLNGLDLNKRDTLPTGFILVIIMMSSGGSLLIFFTNKRWIFVKEKIGRVRVHEKRGDHNNHAHSQISCYVWKNDQ